MRAHHPAFRRRLRRQCAALAIAVAALPVTGIARPQHADAHSEIGAFKVSQGYLYGAHPEKNRMSELNEEQASTGDKSYSLVRDYESTWGMPNGRVGTWASEGKSVVWSAKPPAWSGRTSPWARAAADTTMIDNQIRSLQVAANQPGGPAVVFYAISHEPHDNASDTVQGWHGGASDRECGTKTSPSAQDKHHEPCFGTADEFKALYHTIRLRQQKACDRTGGTTGTLGFPCDKVLVTYIGLASNLTPGALAGGDDRMRPAASDFDVFGADVFNWGCFRKAEGACTDSGHGDNNEWQSFEQLVDDPTSNLSLLDLAAEYDKPAILAEVGSHPGCNGSETKFGCNGSRTRWDRSEWFNDMDRYLADDPEANRYLIGYAYFHDTIDADWRFIDTTAGADVDNRGFAAYKNNVTNGMYRTTAAGFAVRL